MTEKHSWPPTANDDSPEARKEAKKLAKIEAKAAKQAQRDEKLARYKQLRANVRRRRVLYGLFIVLAFAVFATSVWDILYNDSDFMWYVFAAYAVLFVWGLLLLFSRRRHLEEVEELRDLQRVFLEDPGSGEIFQLSANKLPELVGLEFSSPTTGEYYAMPGLDSKHVERVLPEGRLVTKRFTRNGIQGEVSTFGRDPKDISFR